MNSLRRETISDESFFRLEKLCEESVAGSAPDLLKGVEIPDLNDTLEEVDFILSLGLKLKKEGKINFPTPRVIATASEDIIDQSSNDLSVHMSAAAESSPKSSRSQIKRSARRISKVISPIKFEGTTSTCRNNLFSQVKRDFCTIFEVVELLNSRKTT